MSTSVLNLSDEFVVMDSQKQASRVVVSPTVYEELNRNFAGFQGCELIAVHSFESDWASWEQHPNGDEVVVLLAGQVTFVLQKEEGEERVTLSQSGQALIVPQGIWHTAKVSEPAQVLFITPGQGTEHRADSDT